jgi:hypothetical protein
MVPRVPLDEQMTRFVRHNVKAIDKFITGVNPTLAGQIDDEERKLWVFDADWLRQHSG